MSNSPQDKTPNRNPQSTSTRVEDASNNYYSDSYPRSPRDSHNRSNSLLLFLLGVVTTALLGAIGVGLYLFNQKSQQAPAPTAIVPSPDAPSPTSPSPAATTQPTTTSALPAPRTLGLQANQPNGSTLRLTQVSFAEDSIVATLAVTNGYKEPIKLNGSDDMVITDSLGNVYSLAAPPDNSEITIQPGTTLKGQFVFKGRIAPNANSFTLTTNSKFGNSATFSTNPKFVISNIPVQGGG